MSANNNHNDNSLIDAYNQMMARIKDSIESAEAHAVPTLQKAIDQAKQQAIHLGEITLEDAEEIGNYIKRDINDAAEYLMETSHEFSEWLMLDIYIIEQKVLELFLSVADKTRIELEQLTHPAYQRSQNQTSEISCPGSLIGEASGEGIDITTTVQIPPCPKCRKTEFKRAEI